jgi:hypothetical protein
MTAEKDPGWARPAPRDWLSWARSQRTLAEVHREDEGKAPLHYERLPPNPLTKRAP